jgi:hypothetical protein
MTTIAQVSQMMQAVLTTTAAEADRVIHFSRRPDRAKFTASTLTQTLVLGHLAHPAASAAQLAQSAARIGVDVSPQAIESRLNSRTAALLAYVLKASVRHLVSSDEPLAIPLLQRFKGVYVHDSTSIALPDELASLWPGCAGDGPRAALKCGVQLDLLSGTLSALDLTAGRACDLSLPCQQAGLPAGSLRLADLGFFDLSRLAELAAAGCYFLSKLKAPTQVRGDSGPEQALCCFVQQLGELEHWEGEVCLGRGGSVRARLLLQRVPQEVADQRRRRLRKEARDKGRTPSKAALALAAYTILVTNAPPHLLSLEEALVLAKARWQIELLFKLWKSQGKLGRADAPNAIAQLCTVYAQLLAMLLQHWAIVVSCWRYPEHSMLKAAQVVRDHASELASARGRAERIAEVLESMHMVLRRNARLNPRKKHPNTFQLLLALTTPDGPDETFVNF